MRGLIDDAQNSSGAAGGVVVIYHRQQAFLLGKRPSVMLSLRQTIRVSAACCNGCNAALSARYTYDVVDLLLRR